MDLILRAVQAVLSVLIMVSVGYIFTAKRWFNKDTSKLFAKIVVNISLPALMIDNILSTFTKSDILESGRGLLVSFLVVFLAYLISIPISRIIKIEKARMGVFRVMFTLSNTIFIGLPVNIALFGEDSIMYALFYYVANTVFFWTLGIYQIMKDGKRERASLFSMDSLKNIFSPALSGLIIAVILLFLDISLPSFIMDSSKYLGNLTTPLSMMFIGIVIHDIGFKSIRYERGMVSLFLGRFLVTPLLVFIVTWFIPIPPLMRSVFVIQSSLPVMTQTAIIAESYGADYEYASVLIMLTTIASFLTIPIYMIILG